MTHGHGTGIAVVKDFAASSEAPRHSLQLFPLAFERRHDASLFGKMAETVTVKNIDAFAEDDVSLGILYLTEILYDDAVEETFYFLLPLGGFVGKAQVDRNGNSV